MFDIQKKYHEIKSIQKYLNVLDGFSFIERLYESGYCTFDLFKAFV